MLTSNSKNRWLHIGILSKTLAATAPALYTFVHWSIQINQNLCRVVVAKEEKAYS